VDAWRAHQACRRGSRARRCVAACEASPRARRVSGHGTHWEDYVSVGVAKSSQATDEEMWSSSARGERRSLEKVVSRVSTPRGFRRLEPASK